MSSWTRGCLKPLKAILKRRRQFKTQPVASQTLTWQVKCYLLNQLNVIRLRNAAPASGFCRPKGQKTISEVKTSWGGEHLVDDTVTLIVKSSELSGTLFTCSFAFGGMSATAERIRAITSSPKEMKNRQNRGKSAISSWGSEVIQGALDDYCDYWD